MLAFVLQRLVHTIPVVLAATIAIFLLLHLVPGDPAQLVAGPDASVEDVVAVRHEMGLDRPLPVQYAIWLGNMVQGDLGTSYTNRLPVIDLLAQRVPATLELALAAMVIAVTFAIPTGIVAAIRQRGVADWLVSTLNAIMASVPNFWVGILAILFFALQLGWLPPGGRVPFASDPITALKYMLLPAATLALHPAAVLSRLTKSAMLEVLYEDYIRTARAKGLSERRMIRTHALRNSLIPVITVLGMQLGGLLGGTVIIETVFAWPGVGQLVISAIGSRDYPLIQASLLFLVLVFVAVNLVTDLVYGLINPQIRLSQRDSG